MIHIFAFLALAAALPAQSAKPSLPDPIKLVAKFDIVWRVTRSVLEDMEHKIELEDRKAGRIVTKPYEFITGSLTSTEVGKFAILSEATGTWLKARYSAEVVLEIVSPTTTLVTVRTTMEGLQKHLDGSEAWVPLQSLGTFEKRILGKISQKIFGNELDFESKKGFWDKRPQPVDPNPRFPTRPPL